ncbi:hypothetical protein ACB092_03G021800 [Castanea dentata]
MCSLLYTNKSVHVFVVILLIDTYDSASPNSWLKGGGDILWLLKLHDFRQRFSNLDHGED